MQRDPCPTEAELLAFHEGRLPDDESERVATHLEGDGCAPCEQALQTLDGRTGSMAAALRDPHTGPPTSIWETGPRPARISADPAESLGAVIAGRYRLVEVIGEGGMGTVYMAQQTEPVKRLVAVKLIKAGMDSRQVLARFDAERQALALMDHPNIARVLDAGATDLGRPFFAMELVKGTPITRYCDDRRLTIRQRLELFIPVCQAVQHAHQKGLVHRDLKPSNVLVTRYDDQPVPKVIDFGVAKATGHSLTDKTLVTGFDVVVGTPEYMAPEQAEFNQLDVDTRADVYALGVILYELLAGSTPLTRARLGTVPMLEMLRMVREDEPTTPSARIGSADALLAIAASRAADPARLAGQVRGELDWIVMKALEKDRDRRYETANGLARDIQRSLAGEPVEAGRPSARYRLGKLARKHRAWLATAAAFAALLIAATGVSAALAVSESRARDAATRALVDSEIARREADGQRVEANRQRIEADRQREVVRAAREVTRRNLYDAQLVLAAQSWTEHRGRERMAALLNRWLPAAGERDLRGWEWFYLDALLHPKATVFRFGGDITSNVAWSRDGARMAAALGKVVAVWPIADQSKARMLQGHDGPIGSLAWDHVNDRLATASDDGTIRVWDAAGEGAVRVLRGHAGPVYRVLFDRAGTRLASVGADHTLRFWDPTTGLELDALRGGTGSAVYDYAWSPDGARLACIEGNGRLRIRIVDEKVWGLTIQEGGNDSFVLAWSPDGARIAAGGWDHVIRMWDAKVGGRPSILRGHSHRVLGLDFSPDGAKLASVGEDGVVKVWNPVEKVETTTLHYEVQPRAVRWSPDGKHLATINGDAFTIRDLAREEFETSAGEHAAEVRAVAWDHGGGRLASAGVDGAILVRDVDAGTTTNLTGHKGGVYAVAWSPDDARLASIGIDGAARIWDASSGREVAALREGLTPLNWGKFGVQGTDVAWSPNGTRLAATGPGGVVLVWDVATLRLKAKIDAPAGKEGDARKLAWHPDGARLAIARRDEIEILDPSSELPRAILREPRTIILDLAWSPDGKRLASCGIDGLAWIWDISSSSASRGEPLKLSGHTDWVWSIAWSRDGTRLASASSDLAIRLWDTSDGQEVLALRGHERGVAALDWSSDGQRIASGGADRLVLIWDATRNRERKRPLPASR